jgi:hypothetical protein
MEPRLPKRRYVAGLYGVKMTMSRLSILCVSAALALAVGPVAHAQGGLLVLAANDFAAAANTGVVTVPRSSLEWDAKKGRWGLKLGVEQHTDRDVELKDVQTGLYYRITPRLHIGGAVSLAPDQLESSQRLTDPQMPAPRVRLETTFKF